MKSELARRIVFTLGALLIYRLGSYIPIPGVHGSGTRISIFSTWILPYLSAAILIQLVSVLSSKLAALPNSGEAGRRKIARYTMALAIPLTALQAFGIAWRCRRSPTLSTIPAREASFHLTGVSVLVVVCTVLDIERQVRGRSLTEPGGLYS